MSSKTGNNKKGNKKPVKKKNKKPTDNKFPFVSVCTPTFNRRPFIPYMIKCFNNQDYPLDRMEWIIIDDGTDKIEDLVKDHPCVKYFPVDEKMPLGKKRNMMHDKCSGDIIVYMDDDDYYPSVRVSHAVSTLQNNPEAMCAGTSKIYIYYDHLDKVYQFGPYGEKHATAGTFAFHKALLINNRYDDNECLAEEKTFLDNFNVPFVQLDPEKVILVFAHIHNTVNKVKLLENLDPRFVKETNLKVEYLVPEDDLRSFYKDNLNRILKDYEPGLPQHKPDVLNNIIKLEESRRKKAEKHANDNGQIVMKQPDGTVINVSTTQIVNIVQQQQEQMQTLQQQMKNVRSCFETKNTECTIMHDKLEQKTIENRYLTDKLGELIGNNLELQKINTDLMKMHQKRE